VEAIYANTNSCPNSAVMDGGGASCTCSYSGGIGRNKRHRVRYCVGLHLACDSALDAALPTSPKFRAVVGLPKVKSASHLHRLLKVKLVIDASQFSVSAYVPYSGNSNRERNNRHESQIIKSNCCRVANCHQGGAFHFCPSFSCARRWQHRFPIRTITLVMSAAR